jgi:hypothetical protein
LKSGKSHRFWGLQALLALCRFTTSAEVMTYQATDAAGNTSSASATVTVPHNQ